MAPGDRHHLLDLHLRPARSGRPSRSRSAPSTTAPTSARSPSRDLDVTLPLLASSAPTVPPIPAADDGSAAELGLRFTPTVDGFVSGVRFYKGAGNGGTHVGSLWSTQRPAAGHGHLHQRDRHRLAVRELLAGRSRVTAGRPTSCPTRHRRAATPCRARRSPPRASRRRPLTVAGGCGRDAGRRLRQPGAVPRQQPPEHQLLRRRHVHDRRRLAAGRHQPVAAAGRLERAARAPTSRAAFTKPVVAGSQSITVTDAGAAGAGRHVVRRRRPARSRSTRPPPLAADTVYDVHGRRHRQPGQPGHRPAGPGRSARAKAPTTPGVCPCSLFEDTTTPTVLEADDNDAVTLGVRFAPTVDGKITAIRFYKGPDNTGTHTGHAVVGQRHLARHGHLHRRVDDGLADADLRQPGRDHQEHRVRRVVPHAPVGQVLLHARTVRLRPTSPARRCGWRPNSGAYTYGTGFPGVDGRAPTTWSTWCSSATPLP